MGFITSYQGASPVIGEGVFIAPTASVIGNVTLGEGASIWFGSVVRGDLQPITIGKFTNVQDNSTIHVMGDIPTHIGDYVTIGHNTIIHCRSIGNNCLIGMGSNILGYSEIGDNCIIGAGTLLTQHKKIPSNSLVYGNPAKIVRSLRDDEIEALHGSAMHYNEMAQIYIKELGLQL